VTNQRNNNNLIDASTLPKFLKILRDIGQPIPLGG